MPKVEDILSSAREWKKLNERQARETLREVFLVDRQYIAKKFTLPVTTKRFRRPWITEDQGLARLNGRGAPRTYGYAETRENGHRVFWLFKQYLDGETLMEFQEKDIEPVALLMACIHGQRIITDDANVSNFLRRPDGTFAFLDLGRARVFRFRSPWLYLNIGCELAKLRREGFRWNSTQWISFKKHYFSVLSCAWLSRRIIEWSCFTSTCIRMARKFMQGKSPWN
ncbi:MAG TPA: hypothetical protein PJ991_11520 [Kiritimatiellia bacterium]|nr:hypothetical protein [Kiritimatiellia bacterium]